MKLALVSLGRSNPGAALQEVERETGADPFWRRFGLALAYHAAGRKKEVHAALGELLENHKEDSAFQIAEVYAFRGETDKGLRVARPGLCPARRRPRQDEGRSSAQSLESDLRYTAFLKKVGLPL